MTDRSPQRRSLTVMIVAGEPSGDLLAAELVQALRLAAPDRDFHFLGAGGTRMAAAGVNLHVDTTSYAVVGLLEAAVRYTDFRRLFTELVTVATSTRPDLVVCVDFSGFNRRFARAIRDAAAGAKDWRPRIVQYVSPQVWASRAGRARSMARDLDLLLAIFPFEQEWYAQHAPSLRVVWTGHPLVDRYDSADVPAAGRAVRDADAAEFPRVALLPGSRRGELARHIPLMLEAADRIAARYPAASFRMVLPDDRLLDAVAGSAGERAHVVIQVGGLSTVLADADLAIASTGTVTLECAWFGVPTVALYKTSWLTYQIGRRIVTVPHLAMPNLIAGRAVIPELVQDEAHGAALAARALSLLASPADREAMQRQLAAVVAALGPPGASRRAAEAILEIA